MEKYDLIIIWAWSAWYPAWMYASRYKIKNLIIWAQHGWALATSHKVENWPWVISAPWAVIMDDFKKQAELSWSDILHEFVTSLEKKDDLFFIKTSSWKEFQAKYVIIATWNSYKHLWVPWEEEFLWKWVSYCATCDWSFYKNLDVVVVWWWNTALTESLYLADICKKVYLVHRSNSFRAEDIWVEQAKKRENIEFVLNEEVEKISGWIFLEEVLLKSWKILKADWIFVAIWSNPNTKVVDNFELTKDKDWCLIVDQRQETSLKWLYAAWDITTNSNKFKQTIMSRAEWCLAANSVHEDLIKQ